MVKQSNCNGHTNWPDVHTIESRWTHGGQDWHTKTTRICARTFGNCLTCRIFCQHSRNNYRTLKNSAEVTRLLRMHSRMACCVHDQSRSMLQIFLIVYPSTVGHGPKEDIIFSCVYLKTAHSFHSVTMPCSIECYMYVIEGVSTRLKKGQAHGFCSLNDCEILMSTSKEFNFH